MGLFMLPERLFSLLEPYAGYILEHMFCRILSLVEEREWLHFCITLDSFKLIQSFDSNKGQKNEQNDHTQGNGAKVNDKKNLIKI
jgi:hypothetical protein